MAYAAQTAYRDSEVLHASPERLVQMVYDVAIRSIGSARECLSKKDVRGRVRHVNTAFSALVELTTGLDFEAGKEIAQNYARIYDYCQRRLIEGNVRQDDSLLAEVQSLIGDLQEAWQIVVTRVSAERAAQFAAEASAQSVNGSLSVVG
ncbi:MAG TPA: flagellar export chaperone FliS [Bryobacteraceae bacterium]|jgi:flagellar protein FliS